jgi:transcriptional regulator with XRE-family HTH domain
MRKAAGYTQAELAAEVGISRHNITYYETKTQHPLSSILPELALALGVSIDERIPLDMHWIPERESEGQKAGCIAG